MEQRGLRKRAANLWELERDERKGMKVPARIYASDALLEGMDPGVGEQIANVATMPGIVSYAVCMPDGHWGYGFPIGGVAAFDPETGVISPGGIGFDINCGMRLLRTSLTRSDLEERLDDLLDVLAHTVPAGVGGKSLLRLSEDEFREIITKGMAWSVSRGFSTEADRDRTEERGAMEGADADAVSARAIKRGIGQVGTLGSGNHYLEIQIAQFGSAPEPDTARAMGIDREDQVCIMLHTGSRGFGHQIATDYLHTFTPLMEKELGPALPDKQLACAPFQSTEGRRYFAAMQCAVNMAFVNRSVIMHRVREAFERVFRRSPEELGMDQIYDVTHNTAKLERHRVDRERGEVGGESGEEQELLVHRKGATRSFGAGMEDVPPDLAEVGQPVIIGGSMETGSYLLVGDHRSSRAFYTTAHGSGRLMGRRAAKRKWQGSEIRKEMAARGIRVRAASMSGLAEEAGGAYKNIDEVVTAAEEAGLSRRVVRLVPIGNIKG